MVKGRNKVIDIERENKKIERKMRVEEKRMKTTQTSYGRENKDKNNSKS